jgi:hypothetical protein
MHPTKILLSFLLVATAQANKEGSLSAPWSSDSFYKEYPLFSSYAKENSNRAQFVYRFGPVGIGIELTLPAFGMKVRNIEEGSPAAATGKLKPGQIIESINGQKLKDIDPRIQLGHILAKAEASDGKITLAIKENPQSKAETVLVQIPVLGAYSKTWPLNCPKSDIIVRGIADYITANVAPLSALQHDQSLLFLLSTGEEQDLETARQWVAQAVEATKDRATLDTIPWAMGYGATGYCEYYLRTGDKSVLPLIQKIADQAKRTMYNGGWNHRTSVNFKYGHMNGAGVHVLKFLLLAKECDVEVDDHTLLTSLRQFFRFAGRGNVPYGDGLPESGFVDNGKVGGLAVAMAAAVSLMPDGEGEKSLYAKARDVSAVKGFYSTSWMLHGHTGGGIGEVWRSSSMSLMKERKPTKFSEFMDNRTWHLDLSRGFNGAMNILRDTDYSAGYDNPMWGAGYAMTYTVPRKTLRMTGAPRTQFSKPYRLPERPWGRPADDAFYSLAAAPTPDGKVLDVDAEKLATHASWPILRLLNQPDVADDTLRLYVGHPDYNVRQMAATAIQRHQRDHLILELLNDPEPRRRQVGVMAIASDTGNLSSIPQERITSEMSARLFQMIADPDEALWTIHNALRAISRLTPEQIAPHADALLAWVDDDEWWLRTAALQSLTPIANDPAVASKLLPKITEIATTNQVGGVMSAITNAFERMAQGPPEVKELAGEKIARAYQQFPTRMTAPGGIDMQNAVDILQGQLATTVTRFPGGFDRLFTISREIMPDKALAHRDLYFRADAQKFGPGLREIMPTVILNDVIPEFLGTHLNPILTETRWATEQERWKRSQFAVTALDGMVALYNQIGNHDYDWRTFGPERDQIEWEYSGFDSPEMLKLIGGNAMALVDSQHHSHGQAEKEITNAERTTAAIASAKERLEQARHRADANPNDNGAKNHLAASESNLAQAETRAKEAAEKAAAAIRRRDHQMLAGHLPQGLESWFTPEFNATQAGWEKGRAPFANTNGEAKPVEWRCKGNFCGCGDPPNTLWENDVLLMRTTLDIPVLKPDHRYRFLIGGNIHSNQGGPVLIYINGKAVHQQGGFGGRTRGNPRGFFIDKEIAEAISGKKAHIAIAAVRRQPAYLSAWFEEMKLPPAGEKEIFTALTRVPMKSAEWQELQDPDVKDPNLDPNDGKYRYSGKFTENLKLIGEWKVIDQVADPENFQAPRENPEFDAAYQTVTLNSDGKTHDPMWIWTDGKLMDLQQSEALTIESRTLNGTQYLFIENGGFSDKHTRGWASPYNVLTRAK